MEDEPDVPALKGWRYELFGAEAQRLKRGELALKVANGEVVPVAVSRWFRQLGLRRCKARASRGCRRRALPARCDRRFRAPADH